MSTRCDFGRTLSVHSGGHMNNEFEKNISMKKKKSDFFGVQCAIYIEA